MRSETRRPGGPSTPWARHRDAVGLQAGADELGDPAQGRVRGEQRHRSATTGADELLECGGDALGIGAVGRFGDIGNSREERRGAVVERRTELEEVGLLETEPVGGVAGVSADGQGGARGDDRTAFVKELFAQDGADVERGHVERGGAIAFAGDPVDHVLARRAEERGDAHAQLIEPAGGRL
ncbi:MAG: hypothetical protein U5Q44_00145 [Dehalococcoidia bacterium]|nr:hypothetical protein [Dehalococcoidia bacterium]